MSRVREVCLAANPGESDSAVNSSAHNDTTLGVANHCTYCGSDIVRTGGANRFSAAARDALHPQPEQSSECEGSCTVGSHL
jgi:hypothetical protein